MKRAATPYLAPGSDVSFSHYRDHVTATHMVFFGSWFLAGVEYNVVYERIHIRRGWSSSGLQRVCGCVFIKERCRANCCCGCAPSTEREKKMNKEQKRRSHGSRWSGAVTATRHATPRSATCCSGATRPRPARRSSWQRPGVCVRPRVRASRATAVEPPRGPQSSRRVCQRHAAAIIQPARARFGLARAWPRQPLPQTTAPHHHYQQHHHHYQQQQHRHHHQQQQHHQRTLAMPATLPCSVRAHLL